MVVVIRLNAFLGAASPQAVKKLLALSEPSKVSRPSALAPAASAPKSPQPIHRKSNKTLAVVDLTAESSSVTSLPTRKGAQSGNEREYRLL